jgi:putative transposase
VCAYGWQQHEKNGVKLHHGTYHPLREQYPVLPANVLIAARVKAAEALKSAFTWKQKHEASYQRKVAKASMR